MVSKKSVSLFRKAAKEVPAYAKFLETHHLKPKDIKRPKDFSRVPPTSKKNYLTKYSMESLVWRGDMSKPLIFCATSGSTGVPYYFPREDNLARQYSYLIEDYLKASRLQSKKPVLVIIAFGMGVWIGGVITLRAFEIATARLGYAASILPTGFNKPEVIKALTNLSPQFGQTIIVGYPPFVKELVDEAVRQKINLPKLNVRLLFAAESFSETFRDYLCQRTGSDPVRDTLNIYGTADIGAMAYETPLAILIRRLAAKDRALFEKVFGQIHKTPTLAQYNPDYIEFEEEKGEILLTGNSALPLIRYQIGDLGGVKSYKEMASAMKEAGYDLGAEIKKAGLTGLVRKQPFVFVYERANFAVSLQGIIIYPEFIKEALLNPELTPQLSGKFTMQTKADNKQNQYLEINLELQAGVNPTDKLQKAAAQVVRQKLIDRSSEFAEVSKSLDSSKLLKLVFWPHGHQLYFSPGVKQKWSLKEA